MTNPDETPSPHPNPVSANRASALPPRYRSILTPLRRGRRKSNSNSSSSRSLSGSPLTPSPGAAFSNGDIEMAPSQRQRQQTVAQHHFPLDALLRLYDSHRYYTCLTRNSEDGDGDELPWKPSPASPFHPRLVSTCGLVRNVQLIGFMPTSHWLLDPTMPADVKELLGGTPFHPLGHYRVAHVDIFDAAHQAWPLVVIVNVGVPGMATGLYGGIFVRKMDTDNDGNGNSNGDGDDVDIVIDNDISWNNVSTEPLLLPPFACLARITSLTRQEADGYYDSLDSSSDSDNEVNSALRDLLPTQPKTRIISYPEPTGPMPTRPPFSNDVYNGIFCEYPNLEFVEEDFLSDEPERGDDASINSIISTQSAVFRPQNMSFRRRVDDAPTQLERLLMLVVDYLAQPSGADWSSLPEPLVETRDRSTRLERKLHARRAFRNTILPPAIPTAQAPASDASPPMVTRKTISQRLLPPPSPKSMLTPLPSTLFPGSSQSHSHHSRRIPPSPPRRRASSRSPLRAITAKLKGIVGTPPRTQKASPSSSYHKREVFWEN